MAKDDNKLFQTVVIIGGVYFLVVMPILKKLGIVKSAEVAPVDDPFSGSAFLSKIPAGTLLLTSSVAAKYAKTIYDAFGLFGDDEAAVIGVFRLLKTQSQVASLAKRFNEIYKTDLLEYMRNGKQGVINTYWSGLSDSIINQIKELVSKKPKYK